MSFQRHQTYFLLGLSTLTLILLYVLFRPYLGLIVFASVLAILAWPVHAFLLRFFRGNASLAAASTVFLTLMLVILPLGLMIVSLAVEIVQVFSRVSDQVSFADVEATLGRLVGTDLAHHAAIAASGTIAHIAGDVQPIFSALTSNVIRLFSNTVAVLFDITLTLLGMFYLLKDWPALERTLLNVSPLEQSDNLALFSRVREAVRGVAIGSFSMALVKGVMGGLIFFALGLHAPVFWGAMIGLSHYLPVIGTATVIAPFAAYLFATGHFWQGLVFSLSGVLIVGLVDTILGPYIIQSRINVHPMLILISVLGGLVAFGAAGVFFGPIVLAVSAALVDIYRRDRHVVT